jgi:hypothetical protein
MRNRYLVLALAAVLAIAVAVPAVGEVASTSYTPKEKKKEKKQNKRIKRALKRSKKAKNLANQALNEVDALDVRVTTIEQQLAAGGGGGAGPAGPQGPAGPAGPAGPGQAFGASLDGETSTINGGVWSVRFRADDDGVCDQVRISNLGTADGVAFITNVGGGGVILPPEPLDGGDNTTFDPAPLAKYELNMVSPQGVKDVHFALVDDQASGEGECVIAGSTIHLP